VVFYELLTGELPLGRFAHRSKKSRSTSAWTKSCCDLEKEPEQRYQHASQVKTDVQSIVAGVWPARPTARLPNPRCRPRNDSCWDCCPVRSSSPSVFIAKRPEQVSKQPKEAVEAIGRKHGIPEVRVSLGRRLVAMAVIVASTIAFVVLPRYLDLSPIVTTSVAWCS